MSPIKWLRPRRQGSGSSAVRRNNLAKCFPSFGRKSITGAEQFQEEYLGMLKLSGMEYDERYVS